MGSLIRVQNWRSVLNKFILDNITTPHAYGSWDCCMSVGKGVESFTEVPVYNVILPYTSANVKAILKQFGGVEGIADTIAKEFSIESIKLAYAGAGDVVLFKWSDNKQSLGIIGLDASSVYVCNDVRGWTTIPKKQAVRAWRI